MDSGGKKLRQMDNIVLNDTIVSISSSADNFAVGCLDDSIFVWYIVDELRDNKFTPFSKEPQMSWAGSFTGLLDIRLSADCKKLAAASMDSIISIWDLETKQSVTIDVPLMSAWKLVFIGEQVVACGELGHIQFYSITSKETTKKLEAGEIFLTSINTSNDSSLLAVGNNNGDLYIVNVAKKDRIVPFKPHSKLIRSISFSEDTSKVLTGSDDNTLKIFDVTSEKVISSYDGHKESVACVRAHPTDSKVAFTCSFDKSIKIWDLRMKSCIDTFQSGSALWTLEPIGRHLVAGGENGALSVFSVE